MDRETVQHKKKQSAPAYSQRQAEERLAHFVETVPEMKHPNEMETVLGITKDIIESGFDVTAVHQMLADRAMMFVLKTLEEGSLHFVEEFLQVVKRTVANVKSQLRQAGEMCFTIARTKLEEGDIGLSRRFFNLGKYATDELRQIEEQYEARLMQLADEKISVEDSIEVIENYLLISKSIIPDLTPQRQKLTEKALTLAERSLDRERLDLTEKYVGIAALAGGDVTSSQEYLAKKVMVLAEKELQVPIKDRKIDLCWQLIRIVSSVGGNPHELEKKLVGDIESQVRKKRMAQLVRAFIVVAILAGGVYGYIFMKDKEKQDKIEAEQRAEQQRDKQWQEKTAAAKFGEVLYSLEGHTDGITDIALSSDNKYAVSVGNDKSTKVWRLNDGKMLTSYPDNASAILSVAISNMNSVAAANDNVFAIIGSHTSIELNKLLTGDHIQSVDAHADWISAIAVSPDNNFIVSGSNDKTMKTWDLADRTQMKEFDGHTGSVLALAISPDNNSIVSASDDSTVRIWKVADASQTKKINTGDAVKSVALTANGSVIASGSANGSVKLWQFSDGKLLQTIEIGKAVNALAFTSDGHEVVAASANGEISIWSVQDGKLINKLPLHKGSISSLAVSSNNAFIVTSGLEDFMIKVVKFH